VRGEQPRAPRPAAGWIALVLAVGLATGFNCFCFAVLYDAIVSEGSGLSENATQVLTGWGGGMIGVLGAYVGYTIGSANGKPPVGPPAGASRPPELPPDT
jgi:hypothetical protein